MSSPPPGTVQFDVKFNTQAALAAWNGFVQSVITSGAGVKAATDTSAQGFEATQKAIIELQKSQAAQAQEMLKASQDVMAALQKETAQRVESSSKRQTAAEKEAKAEKERAEYIQKATEDLVIVRAQQKKALEDEVTATQRANDQKQLSAKFTTEERVAIRELAEDLKLLVQQKREARQAQDTEGLKAVENEIKLQKELIAEQARAFQLKKQATTEAADASAKEGQQLAAQRSALESYTASLEQLRVKRQELAAQGESTTAVDAQIKRLQNLIQLEEARAGIRSKEVKAELDGMTSLEAKLERLRAMQASLKAEESTRNKERLEEVNRLIALYEKQAKALSPLNDANARVREVEKQGAAAAVENAKKRAASTEDEVRSIKRLEEELKQLKALLTTTTDSKQRGFIQGAIGATQAELSAAKGGLSDYKSKAEELLATIKGGGNTIGSFIQAIGKAGLVSSETGGRLSVLAEAIGASGVSIDGLISGVTSLASGLGAAAGPIGAAVALVIALGTALIKAAEAIYEADIAMISYLKSAAGETAKFQSTLAQLAQVTGATREQIAAITMGLQKFGLNAMTAGVMLERLTGKAVESAKGNKQAAEAFHAFGIEVVDTNKQIKDAGTIFEELAQQTQGLVLDFRQKEALVELFGLRGVKAFEVARAGYANYIKAVKEFNIILTAEQEENLNKYREAAAKLEIVNKGITQSFGVAGSEGIAKLIDQYLDLIKSTEITSEGMHQLVDAFLELNSQGFAVIIELLKETSDGFITLFNVANQILNLGMVEEVTSWSDIFKKFADDLRYTSELIKEWKDSLGFGSYSRKMAEAADEIIDKTDKMNTQIQVSVKNREDVIQKLVKQRVLTEEEAAAQIKAIQDKANADILSNLEKQAAALKNLLRDANAQEASDPGSVTPERLQRLRKQYAEALGDIDKFRDGMEKLNQVTDEHNRSVLSAANDVAEMAKAYTEANNSITESTKARIEEVKTAVADGTKSEIEGAQEVAEMRKQADEEILSNLEDRLAKAQAALDEANANPGSYTQDIIDKLGDQAKEAAIAIEKYKTEALKHGNEDRKAIEKAYATELEKIRKESFSKLETQAKAEIVLIQQKEKEHQITHSQSIQAQYEQSVASLEQKKALIEADLQNEKISVEEKRKLQEQANQVDTQLEEAKIKLKADARQAEIADEADKVAKIQALNNQENARLEIALRQKEQQLRQAGADELTIQMELGKMKEAGYQRELDNLLLIIEAKKAQAVPENELLDLETQRLILVDKIKQAHDAATGALVAGAEQAKDAINDVANEAKQAADQAKAAQEASVGGMISWIANLKNEASKATKENIDEYVDYFQKRLVEAAGSAAALGAGQIAGLLEYYAQEAVKAMDEVLKQQRAIREEENEKRRAEEEAAAKQLAESLQSIRDRELSAQENANKRLADAEKAHRKGMEEAQQDLVDKKIDINQKADDDLVKLNQDRLDREKEAEEKAVEDSLRRERERLRGIADLQQQANDDYLSNSFDLLDQEVELESRRAEISGKAKAGDPEAIAQQKEIDGQLSVIQRKRKDEEKRQADIQKALKSGKSKEEIEAEVAKLNEQFTANQEYQERLAKYEAEGNVEAIKRLKELHAQQVESINAKYAEQERQRVEDARLEAEAIAKQKEDDRLAYEEDKAEIERRRAKDLADAQTDFDNKAKQLDDNLKKARNQHDRALADIKTDTQKALDELKVSWDDYFKFIEDGIVRISDAAAGAGNTLSNLAPGGGGGPGGSNTTYDVNTGQGAQPGGTTPSGGTENEPPPPPDRTNQENKRRQIESYKDIVESFKAGEISFSEAYQMLMDAQKNLKTSGQWSEWREARGNLWEAQSLMVRAALDEAKAAGIDADQVDLSKLLGTEGQTNSSWAGIGIQEQAEAKARVIEAIRVREKEAYRAKMANDIKNFETEFAYGQIPPEFKALVDKVQKGEMPAADALAILERGRSQMSPEQWTLTSKAIYAAGQIVRIDSGDMTFAQDAAELYAKGDRGKTAEPPPGTDTETTGPGRLGDGEETGTTPATEGELTTTEPKIERDPRLFENLMLDIQRMTSREEADAILAKASLAAQKGSLDSTDMGKIKSHVDYYAFLRGFDIGNKAPTGQHGGKVEGPGETATHQPPETPAPSGVTQDKELALPQGAAATGEDLARQIFDAVSKGQLAPIEGLAELDKLLAGKKITPEVHTQYVERINRLAQTATQTAMAKPAAAPGTTGTANASGATAGSSQAGNTSAPPPVTQPTGQHGGKVEGPGETATHQPPETPAPSGVTQDKELALPQGAAATGEDLARQIFDAVSKGQLAPIEGLAELDKLLAGKKITPEVHTQYVERINRLAQTATQTAMAKPAAAPGTTGTANASGAATGSPQAGTASAPPPVTQPIAQTDTNLDLKLSDSELPPSVQRLVEAYEDGKLAFDPAIGEYETAVGLIRQLVAGGQLSDADALRAVKALQAARDAKKRKLEAALQQQSGTASPEPTAAQKPRFVGGGAFPVVNRPGGPAAGQPTGETASLVANMTKGDMSILINVEKAHTIQEIMAAIEAKAKTDMAKKGMPVA